jgi:hypothetical protein
MASTRTPERLHGLFSKPTGSEQSGKALKADCLRKVTLLGHLRCLQKVTQLHWIQHFNKKVLDNEFNEA